MHDIAGIKIHPAAELMPMLSPDDLAALKADIAANGLRQPILAIGTTRHDARILDGRNRALALAQLGRDPWDHVQLTDPASITDAVTTVLSLNVHRRHLSTSQRAIIAAGLTNGTRGRNQHRAKVDGSNDPSYTIDSAAKALNVSIATVKRAKRILASRSQILIDAVSSGNVSVAAAEQLLIWSNDQHELGLQLLLAGVTVEPDEIRAEVAKFASVSEVAVAAVEYILDHGPASTIDRAWRERLSIREALQETRAHCEVTP